MFNYIDSFCCSLKWNFLASPGNHQRVGDTFFNQIVNGLKPELLVLYCGRAYEQYCRHFEPFQQRQELAGEIEVAVIDREHRTGRDTGISGFKGGNPVGKAHESETAFEKFDVDFQFGNGGVAELASPVVRGRVIRQRPMEEKRDVPAWNRPDSEQVPPEPVSTLVNQRAGVQHEC